MPASMVDAGISAPHSASHLGAPRPPTLASSRGPLGRYAWRMTDISNAQLMDRLKAAADTVSAKLVGLSDDDVLAPTDLPGWTRGHVLAHIAHVSNAVARQVEYALRGELIEFYDGGQGGRTQAIEMNAGHSAERAPGVHFRRASRVP